MIGKMRKWLEDEKEEKWVSMILDLLDDIEKDMKTQEEVIEHLENELKKTKWNLRQIEKSLKKYEN